MRKSTPISWSRIESRADRGCGGVLIVEDDEGIRSALAQALHEEGYRVSTAIHGEDALLRLRSPNLAPCLIVLDMMMPVLDGRSFLQLRAADPTLEAIPVVVVTADQRAAREVRTLAVQAVLQKPLSLDQLLEVVGQHCHRGDLPTF